MTLASPTLPIDFRTRRSDPRDQCFIGSYLQTAILGLGEECIHMLSKHSSPSALWFQFKPRWVKNSERSLTLLGMGQCGINTKALDLIQLGLRHLTSYTFHVLDAFLNQVFFI